MSLKPDIQNRNDLVHLLRAFYEDAFKDQLIGRFFTEVVPLDLDTHLPLIADFWDAVVFHTGGYRKNVMAVHQHIHQLSQIRKEHLDRWVELFTGTIDRFYDGPNATLMKQRAASIAMLM